MTNDDPEVIIFHQPMLYSEARTLFAFDYDLLSAPVVNGRSLSVRYQLPHSSDHLPPGHRGRSERDAWARAFWTFRLERSREGGPDPD